MNKLKKKIKLAKKKWEELQDNTYPVIYVGAASCGRAAGALELISDIDNFLKEHSIDARVIQVGCIGPCYLEPLVDIKMPNQPRISYSNVNSKVLSNILKSHLLEGQPYVRASIGNFSRDTFMDIPPLFQHPMLKPQVRIVLRNCGIIDPEEIDHYLATDGYQGFMNALKMSPDDVIGVVRQAGLRGRGGAGFPTFKKWTVCRNSPGEQKYLICNADEGDPGAFMNRSLIESDPHAVLEGMLIAGYAIGASKGIVYIRAEYPLAIERLKKAIAQMRENGLLGNNILGSKFSFDIKIKEGAGAFVCGEETALIASIEGKRGMPRSRPPFPAISGLFGCPTIINNVETLGTLPNILRNGAEWYNRFGKEGNRGTKTFSLVGKIRRSGLIEVQLGTTLREIIFDIGGGVQKNFKAIQTGGPSGGCLSEEFLDLPVDYESLASAGSIMGSGGLIIMDEDTCVVDVAKYFLDFTQKESCGKCIPCRVGTKHMVEILDRITHGEGNPEDLLTLRNLGDTIKKGALCGLGQTAPNPVLTTLRYFRNEYLEHIKDRRCRAVVCKDLIEYRVIKEKCTGCQSCVRVCPTGAISGPRSEPHNLDPTKCIKCRSCYEICRFEAIAGDAIVIRTAEKRS
ncbi:MAG TPA: NADH-quinone oxidoreductase subunit NuoF [Syntrophorhabdaceae bacterium]|nr:NADH-quinone oxidoreductase subunit NuoF [Syntrophorhabdaceae bacterium]HOT41346.1 NADH-quinone oxidoreductase subunit NuoF [Syntrophorhabdaceae bacterium]HPC66676.1 NADH-quinone oxidoreductase subunit NuoF [Syntrophorhabdaceae bacterium]HQE79482.1 NADH-quinone oxidoreductase subunit NuoF [Syntrophorhabdaceae bacterium]HQH42225.1 NADH-quinone oxidoreductase subunit NuoF [Syntrophorhabdaceae bacterium]